MSWKVYSRNNGKPLVSRCVRWRDVCLTLGMVMLAVALPLNVAWSASSVNHVRLWTAPDHSRLVLDLNRSVEYELFRLHAPERVVVDLKRTTLKADFSELELPDPVVNSIRHGEPEKGVLRIVLDVKENARPRSFLLKPMQGKPHRLVIDLLRPQLEEQSVVTANVATAKKDIVVVVDAGHGGEDPGAIGKSGFQEKQVTLAVAKALAKKINQHPGMKAVLTRSGDYFVPLGQRIRLARKAKGDLMISIHADAVRNRGVQGASVYTLAERGATADKVAAALAAKENAADAVGGVSPEMVNDPMVSMILGDMAKRDSLNSAYMLAEGILKNISKVGPIKYNAPKRARFVVLGALEMPSVLVEMDYISNPKRERYLKSSRHQDELAESIFTSSLQFLRSQGRINRNTAKLNTSDHRTGTL